MNESQNKKAVIVGVFILLGLLFLAAGILTIGNLHSTFSSKLHVTTLFDNVNGLQKGNNIWFSGVKIGTVKKLEFFGGSQVRVTLNIDTKVQEYIRKDARVRVTTDGFIGNKIIEIYGGSYGAGAIEENDTLGVEKTFSAEDMLQVLQENNTNLVSVTQDLKVISHDIREGKGSIGKLISDVSLYNDLSAAGASLKRTTGEAERAMSSLSAFSSGLSRKGTLAHQLVTDTLVYHSIRSSARKLETLTDTAASLATHLNTSTRNPKTPVGLLLSDEEAGGYLKSTLRHLDQGSRKLDENMEAAQHSFLLRKYFRKKEKKKTD